jgi:voltage-gated potassium channel
MRRPRKLRVTMTWVWPALLTATVLVLTTAGASAAIETNTVASYWRGLWWSTSLITTVGFIGEPPETVAGAALSAILMVFGFLLLAMVSASLAAIFVREEEQPRETREESANRAIMQALATLERRLDSIEQALHVADSGSATADPTAPPPGLPDRP